MVQPGIVIDQSTIILSALTGLFWGLTYYYIRRGMNPDVEDLSKFKSDAIYGAIAVFVFQIIMAITKAKLGR